MENAEPELFAKQLRHRPSSSSGLLDVHHNERSHCQHRWGQQFLGGLGQRLHARHLRYGRQRQSQRLQHGDLSVQSGTVVLVHRAPHVGKGWRERLHGDDVRYTRLRR